MKRSRLVDSTTESVAAAGQPIGEDGVRVLLTGWRNWWPDVLGPFLLHQATFITVAMLAIGLLPAYAGGAYPTWHSGGVPLIDASWRWDGQWYWSIASEGYRAADDGYQNVAFFPLYPLLIHILALPFGEYALPVIGATIPRLAFGVALLYVYKLACIEIGSRGAARTILYIAMYPAAIFFSAAYPESLFLLLSVAAFYYARQHSFWLAGLCGLLAALTRLQGIMLVIPIAYELYSSTSLRRPSSKWLSILLVPVGLALFAAYLWWSIGDPFAFLHAQHAWQRSLSTPYDSLWSGIWLALTGEADQTRHVMGALNTLAALCFLGLALIALARQRLSYGVYSLASLILPLLSPVPDMPTVSMARFTAAIFPVFFVLGQLGEHRNVHACLIAVSAIAFAALTALFVNWYWVV